MLASCSMYKSEFDCPAGKGAGCMSLSNVFHAIDDGTLDEYLGEDSVPVENKDQTTIWFKAYKDAKGKIHEEREIKV